MKDEHKMYFDQMPEATVEYEIHVLLEDGRWMSVDFNGSDREDLVKKMNDPAYRYFHRPRRLVAIHHKAEVVDWLDGNTHFGAPGS